MLSKISSLNFNNTKQTNSNSIRIAYNNQTNFLKSPAKADSVSFRANAMEVKPNDIIDIINGLRRLHMVGESVPESVSGIVDKIAKAPVLKVSDSVQRFGDNTYLFYETADSRYSIQILDKKLANYAQHLKILGAPLIKHLCFGDGNVSRVKSFGAVSLTRLHNIEVPKIMEPAK